MKDEELTSFRASTTVLAVVLHRLPQLLAVLVIAEIVVLALLDAPLTTLHKLPGLRHAVAETGSRLAGCQTRLHKDAVGDRAAKAGIFLITRQALIDASLIVAVTAEILALGNYFFGTTHQCVFVAHPPEDTGAHNTDHHQHDNDCYDQQSLQPAWHGEPPIDWPRIYADTRGYTRIKPKLLIQPKCSFFRSTGIRVK